MKNWEYNYDAAMAPERALEKAAAKAPATVLEKAPATVLEKAPAMELG